MQTLNNDKTLQGFIKAGRRAPLRGAWKLLTHLSSPLEAIRYITRSAPIPSYMSTSVTQMWFK